MSSTGTRQASAESDAESPTGLRPPPCFEKPPETLARPQRAESMRRTRPDGRLQNLKQTGQQRSMFHPREDYAGVFVTRQPCRLSRLGPQMGQDWFLSLRHVGFCL
jgi:hypothetical protein